MALCPSRMDVAHSRVRAYPHYASIDISPLMCSLDCAHRMDATDDDKEQNSPRDTAF